MKAYAAFGPGDVRAVSLPVPEPDDYEVLVKNEGCLFCNTTDRMVVDDLFAASAYPVLFGHENFGRVVKLGKKVRAFREGDRVICANALVSGDNGQFRSAWGGFAEYGIAGDYDAWTKDHGIPSGENRYRSRYAMNLVIDGELPPEKAGLVFPMSETAGALLTLGDIRGKRVCVIGTGSAGYSLAFFARYYGAAASVVGRREERLVPARNLGISETFLSMRDAAAFYEPLGGADIVIEASGSDTVLSGGIPFLKQDGTFATYAVPHRPYTFDLLRMPGRFRYCRIDPRVKDAVETVTPLLKSGELPWEVIMTHQWDLDSLPEAFGQVRRGEVIKGMICMP